MILLRFVQCGAAATLFGSSLFLLYSPLLDNSGVLAGREDGIILASGNTHRIGVRRDLMHRHAQLLERLVRDLRARGINLG